jgi:hypothetical protein
MNSRGQNLTEYGLILVVVVAAFTAMNVFFKRGIQGVIKSSSDQLGFVAQQEYYNETHDTISYSKLGSAEAGLVSSTASPQTMTDSSVMWDNETSGTRTRVGSSSSSSAGESNSTYDAGGSAFALFQKTQIPQQNTVPVTSTSQGTNTATGSSKGSSVQTGNGP